MVLANSYDNLSVKNIRNALRKKDIPTNRWVLIYLYRYSMDNPAEVSQELFTKYGANICNWLGSGIPLYTVFPKELFETWRETLDFGVAEAMQKSFEYAEHRADGETKYSILQQLGKDYAVGENDYPALVVIDAGSARFSNEIYSVISFPGSTADTIFTAIRSVIAAIRNNPADPEAVFTVCNQKIHSSLIPICRKLEEAKRISLGNVLDVLLKEHSETVNSFIPSMLTFSRASYYNYLQRDEMPLESALEFALELHISPEEFGHLLDFTSATYTQKRKWREGKDRKFEAIRHCLEVKMGFDDTNEYLKQNHLEPIR